MMPRFSHFCAYILCTVSAFLTLDSANAQSSDPARYTIRIDPYMELRAIGPARNANHPLTAANISFTGERWFARTTSTTGSTIQWATDHSFWNTSDPSYRRDARLRLTRVVGSTGAGWQITTAQDQTNTAAGDETAVVQVSGRRSGTANIWMDVTFITGDLATLRGGQYQMTVVGTISAN